MLGADSTLAIVMDQSSVVQLRLGVPAAPPASQVSMSQIKAEIAEGGVPNILLNRANAIIDDENAVWLVLPAVGRIDRFDANGQTVFTTTFNEPEFAAAFAAYVAANATAGSNRIVPLQYFRDATLVGGDLWVLLGAGPDDPASVLVLSPNGLVRQRLLFSEVKGAGQFAIDSARGIAYFAIPDRAELLRVGFSSAN
jgi:hypothetical protein